MHYLVFLPDAGVREIETAAKVAGISDLIDGSQDVLANQRGPNDINGLMVGWLSPQNPRMNWDPSQIWVPSILKDEHGKPRYYVGFWPQLPTQSELRRAYTQQGKWTKFGVEKWLLPTPATVDARAVYADDGSMRWEVTRQFSWLCDEQKTLIDQYMHEFGVRKMVFDVDPAAQIDWLLKLLRINYRLLPEVAVHLDLWIGRDHLLDVFLSTLGLVRKQEQPDA